jgi:hypothetical protein
MRDRWRDTPRVTSSRREMEERVDRRYRTLETPAEVEAGHVGDTEVGISV